MRSTILRYALLGIVTFAVGLVAFLPARIAAGWVQRSMPVTLGGVTGTLFSGHAAYASGPGAAVENIEWTLHPTRLLLGRLSANVAIDSDLSGFSVNVSRSLFGTTRISDLTGRASAGWLAKLGGYTFLPLSGDISVDIAQAAFDDSLAFSGLAGNLRMANTRWQLVNPPLDLGRFATVIDHTDDGVRVVIADSDGPLALDGTLLLTANRRFDLDVRLRARAGADDRLKRLLDQLGSADGEGWHRVREQGRL